MSGEELRRQRTLDELDHSLKKKHSWNSTREQEERRTRD
jgi:hypothetical protein